MTAKRTTAKKEPKKACASCGSSTVMDQPANRLVETTGMFTLALVFLMLLQRLGLPSFALHADGAVSLGALFLVGVTASASSCLALVGGLLLSVSASWCEDHEEFSHVRKFQPLALFNVGRLIGYFVLGGVVALLGKAVDLSLHATGYLTIVLSVVMLFLGLKILHILPKSFCTLPLPGGIQRGIRRLSKSRHPVAALVLGAATFFIPCGFTQSVQLLALGSGSFLSGGLMMLAFALGTLPALLGISALSAFAEGTAGRLFFRFSGALVVLLALANMSSGFTLAEINLRSLLPKRHAAVVANDPHVTIDQNGQQIISLAVSDHGYSPASFTISADKPTWIYATAENDVAGCASQLVTPAFNKRVSIKKGENWLGPIVPKQDFVIACSMGMYRADVHVIQG
jgi:sulfite exporter TauE/SafE